MIDEKYIELMNGELDGVNSPEESKELETYLEAHEEGRQYYSELRRLAEMFDETAALEPPAELRDRILSSIAERETERSGFFEALIAPFRAKPRRKIGLAFCAGLVIGLVIFAVITRFVPLGAPGDIELLTGTLRIVPGTRILSAEPLDFDLTEVSGSARISYTKERILAEIELSSSSEIEIIFNYDNDIHFEGVTVSGPGNHSTDTRARETHLMHTGKRDYLFVFRNYCGEQPPIGITILAGDNRLLEETIQPGRK
jgi:hypothetical protein